MGLQPGIVALGTPEHAYLELDLNPGTDPADLVRAAAGINGPLTTIGGVNVVVGFRPELWAALAPGDAPADARSWSEDLIGYDGYTMPATQHDLWVWIAGGDRTRVFDSARDVLAALAPCATVERETTGWVYRYERDLTGFIDGTENPSLLEAAAVASVPEGEPGAGGSVLLHQLWAHDTPAWNAIGERNQELAMGRTKPDSIELDDATMPEDAHVARTKVEVGGEEQRIYRRNVAYGGVTDHGTVFVGFAADQWRLEEMLRRMAGATDRIRCALTPFLTPVSGGYYTVPSVEALARWAPPQE